MYLNLNVKRLTVHRTLKGLEGSSGWYKAMRQEDFRVGATKVRRDRDEPAVVSCAAFLCHISKGVVVVRLTDSLRGKKRPALNARTSFLKETTSNINVFSKLKFVAKFRFREKIHRSSSWSR